MKPSRRHRTSGRAARAAKLVGEIDAAWQRISSGGCRKAKFEAGKRAAIERLTAEYGSSSRVWERRSCRVSLPHGECKARFLLVRRPPSIPGEARLCGEVLDALWQTRKHGSVPPADPGWEWGTMGRARWAQGHDGAAVYSTADYVKMRGQREWLVWSQHHLGLGRTLADDLWAVCAGGGD